VSDFLVVTRDNDAGRTSSPSRPLTQGEVTLRPATGRPSRSSPGDSSALTARPATSTSNRRRAATGSALFFIAGPGIVVGVVPWFLTRWRQHRLAPGWQPLRGVGALLLGAGLVVLAHAFARFVVVGNGTPAPAAPPQRLVIGGAYGYVRNPMYVAIIAAIAGQALLLAQPVLLLYAAALWLLAAVVVRWVEEPRLRRRFGADYDAYRHAAPAWLPRVWRRRGGKTARRQDGKLSQMLLRLQ
jgi:protein-S-isoprenylcysteine O-methyltransferase Ste14